MFNVCFFSDIREDIQEEDLALNEQVCNTKLQIEACFYFQVATLHKHLLGVAPVESRTAEADALNLMRVTAALGTPWTDWVRNNARPLISFNTPQKN